MQLKVLKALWGMTGSLEEQFQRIADAGYDGIEAGLPKAEERDLFERLLARHNFAYIAMIFTAGDDHVASLRAQVKEAATYHPLIINAHSARDLFTPEQQRAFYQEALQIEAAHGIPIGHETHRHRAFFSPWSTGALLRQFPSLKVTADLSHWCVVCESLLDDMTDDVNLACERALHVHGRVGYEEGPQVPDPRAPEYKRHVERHEEWWDRMVQAARRSGRTLFTFTPEFGPPGYMHTLPYTRQPVADLWEVCLWMADRFRQRFAQIP